MPEPDSRSVDPFRRTQKPSSFFALRSSADGTAAAGFVLSIHLQNPVLAMSALSLAWIGLKSAQGPFWAIPPAFLSGTAAAGGIALINSLANLGGLFGPWLGGWLRETTGTFSAGLWMSAGLAFASGALALGLRPPTSPRSSSPAP